MLNSSNKFANILLMMAILVFKLQNCKETSATSGVENYELCPGCSYNDCRPGTNNPYCLFKCPPCPYGQRRVNNGANNAAAESATTGVENQELCPGCSFNDCRPGTRNPLCLFHCPQCPYNQMRAANANNAANNAESVVSGVENQELCRGCPFHDCHPGTQNPDCLYACPQCPFGVRVNNAESATAGVENEELCPGCPLNECRPDTRNPLCLYHCPPCPFGQMRATNANNAANNAESDVSGVENYEVCPNCPIHDCFPGTWNGWCRCNECQMRLRMESTQEESITHAAAAAFAVGMGGLIGLSGGLFYYFYKKSGNSENMYQTIENDTL